jgi:hypothetical protein
VRWFSATLDVAAVNSTGQARGLAPGIATIQAFVAGQSTSIVLVVRALPPVELTVTSGTTSPYAGQGLPLRVDAVNRLGEPVVDPALTYRSSDSTVVAVDAAGLVFARRAGDATIEVRSGVVTGSVRLSVRPDPGLAYSIEPTEARVRTGDVLRFRGVARTPGGAEVDAFADWSLSGAGFDNIKANRATSVINVCVPHRRDKIYERRVSWIRMHLVMCAVIELDAKYMYLSLIDTTLYSFA